jgi:hypothetical protein
LVEFGRNTVAEWRSYGRCSSGGIPPARRKKKARQRRNGASAGERELFQGIVATM